LITIAGLETEAQVVKSLSLASQDLNLRDQMFSAASVFPKLWPFIAFLLDFRCVPLA
jgi:hypothetical protein